MIKYFVAILVFMHAISANAQAILNYPTRPITISVTAVSTTNISGTNATFGGLIGLTSNSIGTLNIGGSVAPSATVNIIANSTNPILTLGRTGTTATLTVFNSNAIWSWYDTAQGNGTTFFNMYRPNANDARTGINLGATTNQPQVALHVSGTTIPGICNTSLSCATANKGAMCFSNTKNTIAMCNGAGSWIVPTSNTLISASGL